jgi:anti-anti-sigma regulatory factor
MLKITSIENSSAERLLIVEGRLTGPWVKELETAASGVGTIPGCMYIDIASVSFVDTKGIKLLQRLMNQGVVLQSVSPFVQQLLNMKP